MKKIPQDIIGNIALLKFKKRTPYIIRKIKAYLFLRNHPSVTTVLEKTSKFSGKTRLQKTRHLVGEKTKEVKYLENNCTFYFDIDKTYFSPRLSNERKVISNEILKIYKKKKKLKILVMFSGISVFPIVIAKNLKQNKLKRFLIYSNELNNDANEYAKKNIYSNKLQDFIKLIPGDAKDIKKKTKEKFDVIIMTRPNLEETFLKTAIKLSKKGTIIFYHGFGKKEEVLEEIKKETKSKIKNLKIRKAGDIGREIYRWNVEFVVK